MAVLIDNYRRKMESNVILLKEDVRRRDFYRGNDINDSYYIVTDMTEGMKRREIPVGSGI